MTKTWRRRGNSLRNRPSKVTRRELWRPFGPFCVETLLVLGILLREVRLLHGFGKLHTGCLCFSCSFLSKSEFTLIDKVLQFLNFMCGAAGSVRQLPLKIVAAACHSLALAELFACAYAF